MENTPSHNPPQKRKHDFHKCSSIPRRRHPSPRFRRIKMTARASSALRILCAFDWAHGTRGELHRACHAHTAAIRRRRITRSCGRQVSDWGRIEIRRDCDWVRMASKAVQLRPVRPYKSAERHPVTQKLSLDLRRCRLSKTPFPQNHLPVFQRCPRA